MFLQSDNIQTLNSEEIRNPQIGLKDLLVD